jgi:hypothetical protein
MVVHGKETKSPADKQRSRKRITTMAMKKKSKKKKAAKKS